MRISVSLVWVSIADCVLFLLALGVRNVAGLAGTAAGVASGVYWLTAIVGLVLAVYAFLVLTRGGAQFLRKSTVCILFSLIPGCAGLVALLSQLGTKPV